MGVGSLLLSCDHSGEVRPSELASGSVPTELSQEPSRVFMLGENPTGDILENKVIGLLALVLVLDAWAWCEVSFP